MVKKSCFDKNMQFFSGEAVFPKEEFAHYVSKCKAKAQALENKFLEMAKTHQVCFQHFL